MAAIQAAFRAHHGPHLPLCVHSPVPTRTPVTRWRYRLHAHAFTRTPLPAHAAPRTHTFAVHTYTHADTARLYRARAIRALILCVTLPHARAAGVMDRHCNSSYALLPVARGPDGSFGSATLCRAAFATFTCGLPFAPHATPPYNCASCCSNTTWRCCHRAIRMMIVLFVLLSPLLTLPLLCCVRTRPTCNALPTRIARFTHLCLRC